MIIKKKRSALKKKMEREWWKTLRFYWICIFRLRILQENHSPANRYSLLKSSIADAISWYNKATFFLIL